MDIRPLGMSGMGMGIDMGAKLPEAEMGIPEGKPQESFVSSANSPVSLIIQNKDHEKLEELKKSLLASNPDNHITADLPLIGGFAVELAPSDGPSILSTLNQPDNGGFSVFVDQTMGIPEQNAPQISSDKFSGGFSDIEAQFSSALGESNIMLGVEKLHEQGITGKGTTVCILDTGIAPHPDYADRIVAFKDFVWGKTEPYDDGGHGTHCAGIAVGNGASSGGKYVGVAPEANLIGVKVMNGGGQGQTSDIIKGIQWAVTHKNEYNIDVVNLSLGSRVSSPRFFDPITLAVEAASIAGLTMVVAAGNSGDQPGTIESPGNARRAITVGALDTMGTQTTEDDWVASFSSRGPTRFDKLHKPDLVAPGVDINSTSNHGSEYVKMSGTSMAAPFTAGVAALMKQVDHGVRPSQIKKVMMNTADKFAYDIDRHAVGAGIIDPVESVEYLMAKNKN